MLMFSACSESPKIAVFNNSGTKILLHVDTQSLFGRRAYELKQGEHVEVHFGDMLPPGLLLSTLHCDAGYDLPRVGDEYFSPAHGYNPPMQVQVEADLTVTLLPSDAKTVVDSSQLASLERKFGFPVKPLFKQCRTPRPPSQ